MNRPELAVCLDDLKLEIKQALQWAAAAGFRAVDISAVAGPISPTELSHTGRRHFLKHIEGLGLRISSLRGPIGGPGYGDRAAGERRLSKTRDILRLARELRVPVVSTDVGQIDLKDSTGQPRLREALEMIAEAADSVGVVAAIETAGIRAEELRALLAAINCPHLACCCDSGAMLMHGDDPHAVGVSLAGWIRLVRARDAAPGTVGARENETVWGQGRLDTPRFIAAVTEAGFSGDIVLTRTSGSSPLEDLKRAKQLFDQVLA